VIGEVFIVAKHQRIKTPPSTRINNRTSSEGLHRQLENGLSAQFLKGLYFDRPLPFKDPKNREAGFEILHAASPASVITTGVLRINFTL
jgi:hypothetical protein